MGACSCKLPVVEMQPKKVHIKKIIDIFNSYFKNQGVKLNSKAVGKDDVDDSVAELVERHAKTSSKDLLQLMQIDPSFISKVCEYLISKIEDIELSTEQ